MPYLEHFRRDIERCVKCGACRAVCPPFLLDRGETFSARGRMALIKAVLDGKLKVSEIFSDRLATCCGCLACEASCPSGVPVAEIVQAAKDQAVRESGTGIVYMIVSETLKHPAALRATAWLAPLVLHYTKNVRSECRVRPALIGELEHTGCKESATSEVRRTDYRARSTKNQSKGTIAFFPGCAVEYFQPEIGRATKNVLNALGYEVIIPKGLKCCGRPLLSLGDRAAAEEHAASNVSVLSAIKADAIVTACASCGLTFKKDYPTLLRPDGNTLRVLDIHEFLSDRLGDIELAPHAGSVTVHDPCHLGRGQGLSQVLRKLLLSIPHLTIREMRNADRCCGFGGVMRVTHQKLSDRIAAAKAEAIVTTRAAAVVTGCPGCRMQIAHALKRAGSDVAVLHTVQVLEEALRGCRMPDTRNRVSRLPDHSHSNV
jgi:glycolate oxidase iron-sulfur subunit